MNEKLEKQLEHLLGKATPYSGKIPRLRNKPSLFQIIKTKEQAERFMERLRAASKK